MPSYKEKLKSRQAKLLLLQRAYARCGRKAILVLEGWDASGKGGIIRRIAWALDPRHLHVWQIGAPDGEEARSHWMKRFWARLPDAGDFAIFDRSWYGRVLVERVEGFARPEEWQRAYGEIVSFERSLMAEEYRILKIFLDISPEEQLARFKARYAEPKKRWKLTADDLRNRTRWTDYRAAYDDMFEMTSLPDAPWIRIPADDKKSARLAVLQHLIDHFGEGVDIEPPPEDPEVRAFLDAADGAEPERSVRPRKKAVSDAGA